MTDAQDDAVESSIASDGGRVVITFDDFERDAGCDPWVPVDATVERDTTHHHGGSASCRICSTAPSGYATRTALRSDGGRQQYLFAAWVSDDNAREWRITLRTNTEAGATTGNSIGFGPFDDGGWTSIGGAWDPISPFTDPFVRATFFAQGAEAGTCYYFDDVTIVQEP